MNFVKIEALKMWILSKIIFSKCEFCQKLYIYKMWIFWIIREIFYRKKYFEFEVAKAVGHESLWRLGVLSFSFSSTQAVPQNCLTNIWGLLGGIFVSLPCGQSVKVRVGKADVKVFQMSSILWNFSIFIAWQLRETIK